MMKAFLILATLLGLAVSDPPVYLQPPHQNYQGQLKHRNLFSLLSKISPSSKDNYSPQKVEPSYGPPSVTSQPDAQSQVSIKPEEEKPYKTLKSKFNQIKRSFGSSRSYPNTEYTTTSSSYVSPTDSYSNIPVTQSYQGQDTYAVPPTPSSEYGVPTPPTYSAPTYPYRIASSYVKTSYGPPGNEDNEVETIYGPSKTTKVVKHISVFVAPEEPKSYPKTRKIKLQGDTEKHLNIIFIKAPSPPPQPETEVELPAPPEQKTVVYVLTKNPEEPPEIKLKQSPLPPKANPNVYFIRYKNAPKDQYGAVEPVTKNVGSSSSEFFDYGSNTIEPVMVNGQSTEFSSYAPGLGQDTYSMISKRNAQKPTGQSLFNPDLLRPYSYASAMEHGQYGVVGYTTRP